jgi:hypothetical protein
MPFVFSVACLAICKNDRLCLPKTPFSYFQRKRLDMGRTSAGIGGYAITQAQHQKDFPDRTKGDAVLAATVIGKAHLGLKRGR